MQTKSFQCAGVLVRVKRLMETVMDPVGLYTGNWSPYIGGLLKPINLNGICPKTQYRKPFFNGFNG